MSKLESVGLEPLAFGLGLAVTIVAIVVAAMVFADAAEKKLWARVVRGVLVFVASIAIGVVGGAIAIGGGCLMAWLARNL